MRATFAIMLVLELILVGCRAVTHTDAKCVNGFRNDTRGVLTDADLALAWGRAQQQIAQGKWIINALSCQHSPQTCITHAPDERALNEQPRCVSVRGVHGLIDGQYIGTQAGNAVEIDLDHPPVINTAQWEFENVIGERLGFDMGDR